MSDCCTAAAGNMDEAGQGCLARSGNGRSGRRAYEGRSLKSEPFRPCAQRGGKPLRLAHITFILYVGTRRPEAEKTTRSRRLWSSLRDRWALLSCIDTWRIDCRSCCCEHAWGSP